MDATAQSLVDRGEGLWRLLEGTDAAVLARLPVPLAEVRARLAGIDDAAVEGLLEKELRRVLVRLGEGPWAVLTLEWYWDGDSSDLAFCSAARQCTVCELSGSDVPDLPGLGILRVPPDTDGEWEGSDLMVSTDQVMNGWYDEWHRAFTAASDGSPAFATVMEAIHEQFRLRTFQALRRSYARIEVAKPPLVFAGLHDDLPVLIVG